jgi:transcriptional regulator GlxA family with amidase domain
VDVGILLFDGADELDVVGPYRVFVAAGDAARYLEDAPAVHVHLVAEAQRAVRLAHGMEINASATYASCPELDVLVVPGGGSDDAEATAGRRAQQKHPPTIEFVRDRAERASVTASVCTGAFLLAEAGLLDGRRANTHWGYRDELAQRMKERGAVIDIVAERVVDDGDVVTAGGVTSGIDLALTLVGRLCGARVRQAVELMLERETP